MRNRGWLLGLVLAANRAGLRPVSNTRVHALVFLANTLAPVYGDQGIDTRVIKHARGPFYPDAQWDLDRMSTQGLLRRQSTDGAQSDTEDERHWHSVAYAMTPLGREVFEKCKISPLLRNSYGFLVELATAFASLQEDVRATAALHDAVYMTPGRPDWSALIFEDRTSNYSARTADSFDDLTPASIHLSAKERVHLYLDYVGSLAQREVAV